ncbi:VOC family protein [Aeromicrobium sp.]|nr:VOC family protein [Candidatus Saccharibacteria bacterium]
MANIAVKDITSAKEFYERTLGLTAIRIDPSGRTMYKTGNAAICIYESEFAGTNKADYIAWEVGDDFKRIVLTLKEKHVVFLDYGEQLGVEVIDDMHHVTNDAGLAWIQDPDGNLMVIAGNL